MLHLGLRRLRQVCGGVKGVEVWVGDSKGCGESSRFRPQRYSSGLLTVASATIPQLLISHRSCQCPYSLAPPVPLSFALVINFACAPDLCPGHQFCLFP